MEHHFFLDEYGYDNQFNNLKRVKNQLADWDEMGQKSEIPKQWLPKQNLEKRNSRKSEKQKRKRTKDKKSKKRPSDALSKL